MSIKLLSADIASQIAAGEVIERPASVLKELLENSIDAEATQIDVIIQRGGTQLIEVRDNGAGIVKPDLILALTQHATSKIATSEDLAAIYSLGFRGEALASINSVARLTITSNTQQQQQAWSVNQDKLSLAAHPLGTTVTMRDLFYNIPARRKFLRSERTEYQYLEETFRRIALSRFDIGFSLTNHDKLIKTLPACADAAARNRRLINLCGQPVMTHAINIDAEQNGLRLHGWIGSADQARSQEAHQYFFINQRVIRDRLISHAIRQVYQPLCLDGKMPFYCLYLELDPVALDVNVHPTKHEVRFRDARVIHAFLTQTLTDALAVAQPANSPREIYTNNLQSKYLIAQTTAMQNIQIIDNKIIMAKTAQGLLLLDAVAARKQLLLQQLQQDLTASILLPAQTVRLPVGIEFDQDFAIWCKTLGVTLDQVGEQSILLRSVPRPLQTEKIIANILVSKLHSLWLNRAASYVCCVSMLEALDFSESLSLNKAEKLLNNLDNLPRKHIWHEFSSEQLRELLCTD